MRDLICRSIWDYATAAEFVAHIESLHIQPPAKKPKPLVSVRVNKRGSVQVLVNRMPKRITHDEAAQLAQTLERDLDYIAALCKKRKIQIVEKI